jgi:hypothetical protein
MGFGATDTVVARAVAERSSANRTCMLSLSTITEDNSTITIPNCGIMANTGILFNGGTIDAGWVGYSGSVTDSATFTSASPVVTPPAPDPCPSIAGCAYLTSTPPTSGSCQSTTTFNSSGTMTLSPGKYCAQVIVEGGGPTVFNAGVYDFQGGFTANSTSSITGTGVTFYNQGGAFILDGTPTVNLTAPTTGNTAGVLIYQPVANTSQMDLNGGTTSGGWGGMVYLPGASVIVDGAISQWMMLVADGITLNSDSKVNEGTSAFPVGLRAVLVE